MENSPWMERIPNKPLTFYNSKRRQTLNSMKKQLLREQFLHKNTGMKFSLRSHERSLTDLERIALRNRIKKGLSQFQLDQETSCDSPYRQGQKCQKTQQYEWSERVNGTALKRVRCRTNSKF